MKTFKAIEFEQFNKRSIKDRRVKINYIVVSYLDSNGIEYRKSYEFPKEMQWDDMVKAIPKQIQ